MHHEASGCLQDELCLSSIMKNQYFGDINDYRKYGILRALSTSGLKIAVCWMLTENDTRSDGRRISYLQQPGNFRSFDQDLFDTLHKAVIKKNSRTIQMIQKHRFISQARYLNELVSDTIDHRQKYFERLSHIAQDSDLIFFDPDNGIEVKSKLKGKKDSNKYLYWDEVERFWKHGHSLLIYQHFPRVNRFDYIRKLSSELCLKTGANELITFKTSTVAFFLLPQLRHRKKIRSAVDSIQKDWKGMIEVYHLQGRSPLNKRRVKLNVPTNIFIKFEISIRCTPFCRSKDPRQEMHQRMDLLGSHCQG